MTEQDNSNKQKSIEKPVPRKRKKKLRSLPKKPKIIIHIEEDPKTKEQKPLPGFFGIGFDSKKINKRLHSKYKKNLGPSTNLEEYLQDFSAEERVSLLTFWLLTNTHKIFKPEFFSSMAERYWFFKPFDDNPKKVHEFLVELLSSDEATESLRKIPIDLVQFDYDVIRRVSFPLDSKALSKRPSITRNRFGAKAGFREDMNEYFRSASEANFARYLTLKFSRDSWEYEPEEFPIEINKIKKKTIYTPDFKVFLSSEESIPTYFEVKPWFPRNYPGQKKIVAFLEKFLDNKFVLVTTKKSASVIEFYKLISQKFGDRVSILYFEDFKNTVENTLTWE